MLLKLKVKEKEATKNIPRGRPAPRRQGGGGRGAGVGRGDGEEGTPEAPEGGVGETEGQFLLSPPARLPSPGGLARLGVRACKTRAGGGSGVGAPAGPGVRPTWSVT